MTGTGRLRLYRTFDTDFRWHAPEEIKAALAVFPIGVPAAAAIGSPPVEPLGLPGGVGVEVLVQNQVVLRAANRFLDLRIWAYSTEFPIPSFVRFRRVLFWEFPCPAWAVASCSSGPQAGGTP